LEFQWEILDNKIYQNIKIYNQNVLKNKVLNSGKKDTLNDKKKLCAQREAANSIKNLAKFSVVIPKCVHSSSAIFFSHSSIQPTFLAAY